ncbi:hypothetical protein GCM10009740_32000 [Terrabacter terrae]|uniref:Flavodoxin-like domain-containing protein n=1 Tax=Terrabacter terrae TaxID=318434 RepID=A0ABN3P2V8_9MICO
MGNTEVLARMIAQRLSCDIHRIEALDPYPRGYDQTVARNVREQDADARPGIANRLASVWDYDDVLLGSPIWNARPPMRSATQTRPSPRGSPASSFRQEPRHDRHPRDCPPAPPPTRRGG